MKINTALILCAGYGKRLNPLTLIEPKPLLKVKEITLLENCINLIRSLGRSSGRLIDKSKEFKIQFSKGFLPNVPILSNAYLSFECRKKYQNKYGTHTLFVGKVELIHTENKISKKSILDTSKISPTLYLGADHYISINKKSLLNLKSIPFHKSYSAKNIKLIK